MPISSGSITTITTLLALSGWGKIFYDHFSFKPKISGAIINVLRSHIDTEVTKQDGQKTVECRSNFMCYAYLVNSRQSSIDILDYQLHVELNGKWIRLVRWYSLHKIKSITFEESNGNKLEFGDHNSKMIYNKGGPIGYGHPKHGFVFFQGDDYLYNADISRYKLVCIDAFGKKHSIITKPSDFRESSLMEELSGITITRTLSNPISSRNTGEKP